MSPRAEMKQEQISLEREKRLKEDSAQKRRDVQEGLVRQLPYQPRVEYTNGRPSGLWKSFVTAHILTQGQLCKIQFVHGDNDLAEALSRSEGHRTLLDFSYIHISPIRTEEGAPNWFDLSPPEVRSEMNPYYISGTFIDKFTDSPRDRWAVELLRRHLEYPRVVVIRIHRISKNWSMMIDSQDPWFGAPRGVVGGKLWKPLAYVRQWVDRRRTESGKAYHDGDQFNISA